MVAKVQITATVAADGSIRLLEHDIESAGLRAGDRVRVEIVRDREREHQPVSVDPEGPFGEDQFDLDALARLPFDEWLSLGRAHLAFGDLSVTETRGQAEKLAADEWWERFERNG